jgi:hypothetical protein
VNVHSQRPIVKQAMALLVLLAAVLAAGCSSGSAPAGSAAAPAAGGTAAQPATPAAGGDELGEARPATSGASGSLSTGASFQGVAPSDADVSGLVSVANPSNSVLSSNGAYLQSAGICGGAATGFDITSQGFDWLQVGVTTVGSGTVQWGQVWQVPQNYRTHYPLPISYQSKIYVVVGWDLTAAGWEDRVVITSFDRVLSGAYSTWFC